VVLVKISMLESGWYYVSVRLPKNQKDLAMLDRQFSSARIFYAVQTSPPDGFPGYIWFDSMDFGVADDKILDEAMRLLKSQNPVMLSINAEGHQWSWSSL
jgi:hypothetical protein